VLSTDTRQRQRLSNYAGTYVANSLARYDPLRQAQGKLYGNFRTQPATNPGVTSRGFTGHQHNNTGVYPIGLIYMNARYYLPEAGRFISPDTIVPDPSNPQSYNRYAYALNWPINLTDPSGRMPCYLYCPGDSVNAQEMRSMSNYHGPWDVDQQRASSAKAEALLVEVAKTGVGIAWEPAGWVIALSDGVQWYDGISLLPLAPAAIGDNIERAATRFITAGMTNE
jgi:RHS repeat-associated protein